LVVVVGVSGSGKSSLILDTLVPALSHSQGDAEDTTPCLPFQQLRGERNIDGCVAIDQSPIAKSIRSSPATYTKVMDEIRSLFGSLPDTKLAKMTDSHFSFNSAAGRCPACEGLGFTVVDMQFMADVRLPCTDCQGRRFRPEVLAIRYRDRSIAEVLEMSVSQASDFFRGQPRIQSRLAPLIDIGLGYLPLGQSVSSLSAGESMRLKLAAHLGQQSKQLIVMDEPTTGLHFADVDRLVDCLDVLIAGGNSLLVIEHNEQLIRRADYVIELGPGAGPAGGSLLFSGTRDAFFQRSDTPTSRSFQSPMRGKR
jgi:excinuclease ABC subunit A